MAVARGHKILIAVLSGSALASFFVLLLNVPAQFPQLVAMMFLAPGGILATVLSHSNELSPPPLAVLTANALVYSVVAFIVLIALRGVNTTTLRLVAARLAIPTLFLVGLACVPAFNPLWPHGMAELTKQEKELREALPLGIGLDQARAVLQSKRIEFEEWTEVAQTVVLETGEGKNVTADRGDMVISTRLETEASQFPCGYQIEIALVFGQDKRMKQQHIQRFPICP